MKEYKTPIVGAFVGFFIALGLVLLENSGPPEWAEAIFLYLAAPADYFRVSQSGFSGLRTFVYYILVGGAVGFFLRPRFSRRLKLLAIVVVLAVHVTLFYLAADRYADNIAEAFGLLLEEKVARPTAP